MVKTTYNISSVELLTDMICIAKNSKTKINNDTIDVLDLIMLEQHEHYTITALERDQ
jgi:hypothetical protein